jgi:hypothetical protein
MDICGLVIAFSAMHYYACYWDATGLTYPLGSSPRNASCVTFAQVAIVADSHKRSRNVNTHIPKANRVWEHPVYAASQALLRILADRASCFKGVFCEWL